MFFKKAATINNLRDKVLRLEEEIRLLKIESEDMTSISEYQKDHSRRIFETEFEERTKEVREKNIELEKECAVLNKENQMLTKAVEEAIRYTLDFKDIAEQSIKMISND